MSIRTCLGGAVASLGILTATHAFANDPLVKPEDIPGELSANVAVTSEYYFRGISQSDDVPALQGGFDYGVGLTEGIGLYAGLWGSTINFADAEGDGNADGVLEMDFYGGLDGEVAGFSWSAGFIYYYYPGAASSLDYDFVEAAFSLGYDFGVAAATGSVNYSPDYFAGSGDAVYYALGVDVPIGRYVTLSGHVGRQQIDDNAAFGTPDYTDYSIGGSVNVVGFDVSVTWTDTDLSSGECYGTGDLCGSAVVLSVSRSF